MYFLLEKDDFFIATFMVTPGGLIIIGFCIQDVLYNEIIMNHGNLQPGNLHFFGVR